MRKRNDADAPMGYRRSNPQIIFKYPQVGCRPIQTRPTTVGSLAGVVCCLATIDDFHRTAWTKVLVAASPSWPSRQLSYDASGSAARIGAIAARGASAPGQRTTSPASRWPNAQASAGASPRKRAAR
jgi:hypothetical protein